MALNFAEITPLARVVPFDLESSSGYIYMMILAIKPESDLWR
jgi:hypothetical protein